VVEDRQTPFATKDLVTFMGNSEAIFENKMAYKTNKR
jgi:hypothetical protein